MGPYLIDLTVKKLECYAWISWGYVDSGAYLLLKRSKEKYHGPIGWQMHGYFSPLEGKRNTNPPYHATF